MSNATYDLSKLRQLLAAYELLFRQTNANRKTIDDSYGVAYSPVRDAQLTLLRNQATSEQSRLRAEIRQEFANARQAAQAQGNAARAAFAKSSEGRDYLAALGAYGTIASRMTADQLANKIHEAADAGLLGELCAWRELATLHTGTPSGALNAAMLRSETASISPLEAAATMENQYLDNAARLFQLQDGRSANRLTDILNGQDDWRAGALDPSAILEVASDSGEANA